MIIIIKKKIYKKNIYKYKKKNLFSNKLWSYISNKTLKYFSCKCQNTCLIIFIFKKQKQINYVFYYGNQVISLVYNWTRILFLLIFNAKLFADIQRDITLKKLKNKIYVYNYIKKKYFKNI